MGSADDAVRAGPGMQTAEEVADLLLAAVDEDRFVVPTFPVMGAIGKRIEAIERMATPRPPRS